MLRRMAMKSWGLASILVVALISGCADSNGRDTATGGAVPLSPEAACPGGFVTYNADHVAGATGAASPAKAVRAFLDEERLSIRAAEVREEAYGLRYLDADGRTVAELFAAQYDDATWLLNRGSWCSDHIDRDG